MHTTDYLNNMHFRKKFIYSEKQNISIKPHNKVDPDKVTMKFDKYFESKKNHEKMIDHFCPSRRRDCSFNVYLSYRIHYRFISYLVSW